jgi:hypothetical protein
VAVAARNRSGVASCALVIRPVRTAAALLAVVLTAAGCGFMNAMAHPEEQTAEATSASSTSPATPDPDEPVVIVNLPLNGGGSRLGQLVVRTGSVHTGLALPYPEMNEGCRLDSSSLQYVPVTFTFDGGGADGGLAAHLTVTPGPDTPADIGDVGVFFRPTPGHDVYCQDSPPLPTTDTFWVRGGPSNVDGWVVVSRAVTPATPQGRPDVFLTLQARIDHIRLLDGDDELPLSPAAGPVGTPCADDAEALCVPLR